MANVTISAPTALLTNATFLIKGFTAI
jgi:hypothetical protein